MKHTQMSESASTAMVPNLEVVFQTFLRFLLFFLQKGRKPLIYNIMKRGQLQSKQSFKTADLKIHQSIIVKKVLNC